MQQRKFIRLWLIGILIVLFLPSHSQATYVQKYGWWDGSGDSDFYYTYSTDTDGEPGGDTFDFSVDFELWQDDVSGLYEYRYQIKNTDDESNAAFQSMEIDFTGTIIGSGVYPGSDVDLGGWVVSGSTVSLGFNFPDYLAEGSKSDIFYLLSYDVPILSSLRGEGIAMPLTVGNVPSPGAPVPEPATITLFGAGLIGIAGIGRKKLKT